MLEKFWRYNVKLAPLHILLTILLVVNILMSATREDYFFHYILMALPQVWILAIIPNLIFLVKNRKEHGAFQAFLTIALILPVPYVFIILLMRLIYV
ncbi:hypothetical protein [Thalassobacillus devorans]|uniref:hypothetical protein n=1 Tax=Thalassobacillus devorans TaxID=279813 RepID=UPI00048C19BB|nr:hypothetical protein [Thalassobacillus devorans]